jgi:DNA-directed RNA polymerase subunit RPC12/RpoP
MTREEIVKVLGEETTNIIESYLLADKKQLCKWVDYEDHWVSSCGLPWTFEESGHPNNHGVIHCPRCGKKVVVDEVGR